MLNGSRLLFDNACYHIITRGNQKQQVFNDDEDCKNYLKRLKKYKQRYDFKLYGYCLMPNHVHLIGEIINSKNLSNFMHDLTRSYTAYFNKKYQKVGHLWQGRFKSKIILKDRYLISCINYIELNPIRANIINNPTEYIWSSYKERNLSLSNKDRLTDSLYI